MSVAILILLSWVSGLYLYALDHTDPVTSMLVFCKMRTYVLQASGYTYRWCLTVACFDRFALTAVNVHLRNLAQVRLARRAVIVIAAVWIVLPMYSVILNNLRGNTCGIIYSSIGALYHSIFTTVAATVLPTSIMATCALLIYRNLLRKQKQRQLMNGSQERTGPNKKQKLQSRRDQQVLLMLLIQAICYVGTTTPLMGMYFYNALTIYVSNKSADRIAIERFSFYLAELINFLFPASSFYLYTISSKLFRRELVNMLCFAFHLPIVSNTTRVLPMTNGVSLRPVTEHELKVKSRVALSTAHQETRKIVLANVQ
jgi:hypothetical protein